ncbi:unnamed protein product [Amoebophrya sp. A25]|nr:unnamed protein product [Amoebophrya sp. A25]|eukprot:GSA25T00003878001.1
MGKSAKFMRVAAHEKQKRVLKGKEWRDSGHKQARLEAKQNKRRDRRDAASLLFGTGGPSNDEDSAGGRSSLASAAANRGSATTALPFNGDLAAKLRANYDAPSKPEGEKKKGIKPKKVKMGKIKLKQA